jgi:aminoglycoside 3-N-acetyltransferase I
MVKIARLGVGDHAFYAAMLDLFGTAFEDASTYGGARPDKDYVESLLADPAFVALVACDDERVVGALVAYELRKFEQRRSEFYIYDLAVTEQNRRRGIATALIGALKPIAAARGGWVILVQADHVDPPAVALYTKLGRREDVYHFDIAVD